jgi:hypothetical protein
VTKAAFNKWVERVFRVEYFHEEDRTIRLHPDRFKKGFKPPRKHKRKFHLQTLTKRTHDYAALEGTAAVCNIVELLRRDMCKELAHIDHTLGRLSDGQ